jgi:hypothetical protein
MSQSNSDYNNLSSGNTNAEGSTVPSSSATGGSSDSRMLTGMFRDRDSAERAYNSLSSRGYNHDDVDVMMTDDTRKTHFGDDTVKTELGNKAMEGAGTGSAIGGTLGAIVGAVAAIGTNLLIPGLGLVVAGPIAAALAGAGAGGLTGGLIGGLIGHGIPEDRAKRYEEGLKNGHIVMGVRPRNEEDAAYFQQEWKNTAKGESVDY